MKIEIELTQEEVIALQETLSDVLVRDKNGNEDYNDISHTWDKYPEFLVHQAIGTGQIADELPYFVDHLEERNEIWN
ncbi:hypothetical protein [Weissella confusa]|uniref:hypothetical protein n=1 Tax=Weissella confusa TaxID=1583 RepID=UPI00223C222C|nr:hypothetical protein [Weissella confusa]MCS9991195.1 hypothetical protein [Weissella confusa]